MGGDTIFKVLLVDDEAKLRASIREMLSSEPGFQVVGEADGKAEALNTLREHSADVIFSDIQMEGGSGFELAEAVHRLHPDILVVFLTGYADFALEGYLYGPVDFLVKPVSRERLEQTLKRIRERLSGKAEPMQTSRIGISTDSGYRIVDAKEIAYLVKQERRVKIVWKDDTCDYVGKSMQEMEEILLDYEFFRCHQSCLAPLRDIRGIRKEPFGRSYKLLLQGGAELPLSRQKYYELRGILREWGICE